MSLTPPDPAALAQLSQGRKTKISRAWTDRDPSVMGIYRAERHGDK